MVADATKLLAVRELHGGREIGQSRLAMLLQSRLSLGCETRSSLSRLYVEKDFSCL